MPQFASVADAWWSVYEAATHQDADGRKLPYRLLKPERIKSGESYPLVLYLHGSGDRGTDNHEQLLHAAAELAKPENRRQYPCFVVAPQCPPDCRWVEVDWSSLSHTMPENPSAPLKLTLELLDKLAVELPVDRARIYITGLSMGGFGAWDAMQRRPECFAAAIACCGGGDSAEATKLKSIPIWAFHGDQDPEVPVCRTTDMIDAIRKAGGTPRMTIYRGVDHNCWSRAYADPEVWSWLFGQKKPR